MYFIFMPLSYFPSGVVRKSVDIWNLKKSSMCQMIKFSLAKKSIQIFKKYMVWIRKTMEGSVIFIF